VTLIIEQAGRAGSQPDVARRCRRHQPVPVLQEDFRYGAHNQRSHITLEARLRSAMSIEELVRLAEEEASCEVFGLLKRPDEKWVTERAYDNPKFVEDLVRDIALRLMSEPRIAEWKVLRRISSRSTTILPMPRMSVITAFQSIRGARSKP
jgi:GTP cyclohydrolase I